MCRAGDRPSATAEQVRVTRVASGAGWGLPKAIRVPGAMAEHEWHLSLPFQNTGDFPPLQTVEEPWEAGKEGGECWGRGSTGQAGVREVGQKPG